MTWPDTTSITRLASSAYRDARDLSARKLLYGFQQPKHDLPGIVLERLPAAVHTLLDVGCGNGFHLSRIRAERPDVVSIGVDISPGVMADVAKPTIVGNAAALPVVDECADVVLEMHMLYHVESIHQALSEAVRVLRTGGVFVASTNARDDKRELGDLWSAAAADVLGVEEGPRRLSLSDRFPLEDAPEALGRHFTDVRVIELPGTITVYTPDPVIAHLASYQAWADSVGVPFEPTLDRARQLLTARLDRDGEFRITCLGGIVIGS